jgi:hypothetical protein
MDHPVPLTNLSLAAAKIADPAAPTQLKMMAASGLAPLGPADLLKILYLLAHDGDAAVSAKARETIEKLPDNVCQALDQISDAAVIDGLAPLFVKRGPAIERVFLNRATADETVAWLAGRVRSEALLEVVFANEERLLRCPRIIEALYLNAAARMSSVDRAIELAVRHGIELEGIPTFAEIKAAVLGAAAQKPAEPAPPADGPADVDLEFMSVIGDELSASLDEAKVDDILGAIERGEIASTAHPDEHHRVSKLESSLSGLNISQKIRLATLGNANQRAVLVRDSNKLVVMAVLKSPGMGDSEVIRYSKARSLPEEAIRHIAHTKEWTKLYQVKLNLVNNPRTPMQDALKFLTHLRPNDVRLLETSRDVPRAICNAARQLRAKRQG